MTKAEIRKNLEEGVAVFLASGKQITKCQPAGEKKRRSQEPKEEMVEIEIDFLPAHLRKKHFGDE